MEYEYTNEAIIEQNINPSNKDEGDYMLIADFKLNNFITSAYFIFNSTMNKYIPFLFASFLFM